MSYTLVLDEHGRPRMSEQGLPYFQGLDGRAFAVNLAGLLASLQQTGGQTFAAPSPAAAAHPFAPHANSTFAGQPTAQALPQNMAGDGDTARLIAELAAALQSISQQGTASGNPLGGFPDATATTPLTNPAFPAAQNSFQTAPGLSAGQIPAQTGQQPLSQDDPLAALMQNFGMTGQQNVRDTSSMPFGNASHQGKAADPFAQEWQPQTAASQAESAFGSGMDEEAARELLLMMQSFSSDSMVDAAGFSQTIPAMGADSNMPMGFSADPASAGFQDTLPAESIRTKDQSLTEEEFAEVQALAEAPDHEATIAAEQPAGQGAEAIAENGGQVPASTESMLAELQAALESARADTERLLSEKEQALQEKERIIHELLVKNAFSDSSYLREKTVLPPEFAYAALSPNFNVEYKDGQPMVVAKGADGNPIFSKADATRYADPEEAIRQLIEQHPRRSSLLRASMPGGGSGTIATARAGSGRLGPEDAARLSPAEYVKARRNGKL